MTDISKIEERLFLLLDTVEKQAEENITKETYFNIIFHC